MPGLVPGIHVFFLVYAPNNPWMAENAGKFT